jgi:hypothetical protein
MSAIDAVERWRRHGPMTDPREDAQLLGDLPADVAGLCTTIGRLLIHCDWLPAYGIRAGELSSVSRETLPVAEQALSVFLN